MTIHLRREVSDRDVPLEFMKLALSHLEAAEELTSLMSERAWPSNYYRGQAVLLLIFHAVELFLKGFILKLAPATRVDGHSLAALTKKLKGLASDIEFDPPFKVEALTIRCSFGMLKPRRGSSMKSFAIPSTRKGSRGRASVAFPRPRVAAC